jgi:hypothetical protein
MPPDCPCLILLKFSISSYKEYENMKRRCIRVRLCRALFVCATRLPYVNRPKYKMTQTRRIHPVMPDQQDIAAVCEHGHAERCTAGVQCRAQHLRLRVRCDVARALDRRARIRGCATTASSDRQKPRSMEWCVCSDIRMDGANCSSCIPSLPAGNPRSLSGVWTMFAFALAFAF